MVVETFIRPKINKTLFDRYLKYQMSVKIPGNDLAQSHLRLLKLCSTRPIFTYTPVSTQSQKDSL